MAVSRKPGRTGLPRVLRGFFESVSRYDLLLAVLPLGFLLSWVAHFLTAIPFRTTTVAGALFGLAVLVDALFVHPPTEKPPRTPR